jgi:multiple antibiotic resistance protein
VSELAAFGARSFLTLFVVVDPVGLAPVFIALVGTRTAAERSRVALRAVSVGLGILLAFTLAGSWLLAQLGISIDAFRVAGGLLLFRIAVGMVFAQHERGTPEEEEEARGREDVSVFPLAIPMLAGPGAMASVMILAGEAKTFRLGLPLLLGVLFAVVAMAWSAFRAAGPIAAALGQTGVNVVTRVLGVLLAALAVQYVADGARVLLGLAHLR